MQTIALSIFIFAIVFVGDCAKILMFPTSINSHIIFYSKLGKGLANEGHEVELLLSTSVKMSTTTYKSNISSGSLKYVTYNASVDKPFSNSEEMSKAFVEIAMAETSWVQFWKGLKMEMDTTEMFENDCLDLMRSKEMLNKLSESGYQFAIVDFVVANCRFVLPFYLDIPYGTFSIPWFAWLYRVPRLQSYTPYLGDNHSNVMGFYDRVSTLLREIIFMYFCESMTDFSQEFLPPGSEKMNAVRLMERANLWFFLEDLSVGYPNANMPNTISIGDIMIEDDIKPLPTNVEDFIGKKDTAIVSFGSYFDHVPDSIIARFCESFKHLSGKLKFIWKLNKPKACPGADNVLILNWLPQNDLLAHPKVKFFITHGGLNSIIESVNHKKPMIIMPIALDQPSNSAMASSKGYAISLSLSSFTVHDLVSAIEDISNNSSYTESVRFYSKILSDKPEKPETRVSRMIEHVLKYGDKHLRTSAYQLTPLQFIMMDVVAFLTVIVIIISVIAFCLLKRLLKFLFRLIHRRREENPNSSAKKVQ